MDCWYAAHEIGHSLGASHDKLENNCETIGIMGDYTNPFLWSNCTNNYIFELLVDPFHGVCLHNEPEPGKIIWDFGVESLMPGHKYNTEKQCAQFFGPKYTKATEEWVSWIQSTPSFSNPCRNIWCSYDLVKVSARYALEGTHCILNNRTGQCKVGRCVT